MKYLFLLPFVTLLIGCPKDKTWKKKPPKNYQIAFYNVENLFDTLNTPKKRDGEYTPTGSKEWDSEKYYNKLNKIAQVLASIDSVETLAAVGLAEIENKLVLEDLVKQDAIKHLNLKIIHKESPDFRGIDVALLYNPTIFKSLSDQFLNVKLDNTGKTTRDILKARLVDTFQDTLLVYVNHWPSRWGGTKKSEPKRIVAAKTLRNDLEKEGVEVNKILIIGDLNDYPSNTSVWNVLRADTSFENSGGLVNTTYPIHIDSTQGTHAYKGHWGVLDHIIVSPLLLNNIDTVYVHKRQYMLYKDKKGNWFPSRTHSGKKYYGGYSDHLPVIIRF